MSQERFAVIINVFLSSEEKLSRLIRSVELIVQLKPSQISIRVRGPLKNKAFDSLTAREVGISPQSILIGDEGLTWIEATLRQLDTIYSPTVLLAQEDHWLVDKIAFESVLEEFSELQAQFCHVTFFPQVSSTLALAEKILGVSRSHFTQVVSISSAVIAKELRDRYAITLVGLFSNSYLRSMLLSPLDAPLRYGHGTPFVFERKFGSRFIAPVNICFPNQELFACVDDDHGVEGYSLHSRGIAPPGERVLTHRGPILDSLTRALPLVTRVLPQALTQRLVSILGAPIWLRNTLEYRKYLRGRRIP